MQWEANEAFLKQVGYVPLLLVMSLAAAFSIS